MVFGALPEEGNSFGQLGVGGTDTSSRFVPVQVSAPVPQVTAVRFGGTDKKNEGADLSFDSAKGVWSVSVPSHAAGVVDVTVDYKLSNATQSVIFPNEFTYFATVSALPFTGAWMPLVVLGILSLLGVSWWSRRALGRRGRRDRMSSAGGGPC